jgi:DNA-binding beta-propeller fold protein YncE
VTPSGLVGTPAGLPGCSTATGAAPLLAAARAARVAMPGGSPFGVVVTPGGHWAFVADGAGVTMARVSGALVPAVAMQISLTAPVAGAPRVPGPFLGEALTPDGRYLLVATGSGALVISVARAEQDAGALAAVGMLASPVGSGAIEVAVSPDSRFAFVTLEDAPGRLAVFNLAQALTRGFGPGDYVGIVPLPPGPVGVAVSPDGRWLYATSEEVALRPSPQGALTVIDLRRAETDPARAVVATVRAGCSPVRVITSADGQQVWVTARGSDDLLCFSAARLRTNPAHALAAVVRVGEAPVGLGLVDGGRRVVVADSDRFLSAGASADLDVVDVAAALAGRPALIGHVPAGAFPREMALEPGGQVVLVTNYGSGQLEAVSVPTL